MEEDRPDPRGLLGGFVRAHRERLAPQAAGLPRTGRRRRTPGLRREEAAELAGISTTWLTWIEQGRPVQVSPGALGRLAVALQLTAAERAYLFALAGARDPAAAEPAGEAPPALAAAVAGFEGPAYGLDRCWNAVAWNAAAERLFAGWLDGPQRNLLRFIFLDPKSAALIAGWEDRARRVTAEFRADFSRAMGDPQMQALVAELKAASPAFSRFWDEQAVLAREGGLRRFNHPSLGFVEYEQFTFTPAERPDAKLVLLRRRGAAPA